MPRASQALEAPSSIPPHLHARSAPPELYTSIRINISTFHPTASVRPARAAPLLVPLYFYVPTPTARLQRSTPPRRYAYCIPPELHTSIPSRLHDRGASPELRSSVPLYLHICTHAARFHTSIPPYFHTSTSLHLSVPPELQSFIPLRLHVPTPAAHVQTSMSLTPAVRLLSSRAPNVHTSSVHASARSQSPRAPELHTS